MAGGWAPDGAEQAQIDANLDDALAAAPSPACSCVLPAKKKRTSNSVFRLPTTGAAARTAS